MRTLGIRDFARCFGASHAELRGCCGDLLEDCDFRYRICPPEEKAAIIQAIWGRCERGEFSVSGPHRKSDWVNGWNEILGEFRDSGFDLNTLTPKDIHGDRPMRLNGEYIVANSASFERDYATVFRTWLFRRYFASYANIYEFGCGTGHNLLLCAKLFNDKNFYGFDWAPSSQRILELVSTHYNSRIHGYPFDLFEPDHNVDIHPNSIAYTSAALEQLGKGFAQFLDFLLAKKPSLCINVECLEELYDEDNPFDKVALRYHKARGYLEGYLTALKQLEIEKKIEIIDARRLNFGSLFHEVYSFAIWRPLL